MTTYEKLHATIKERLLPIFRKRKWKCELLDISVEHIIDIMSTENENMTRAIRQWEQDTLENFNYEYRRG